MIVPHFDWSLFFDPLQNNLSRAIWVGLEISLAVYALILGRRIYLQFFDEMDYRKYAAQRDKREAYRKRYNREIREAKEEREKQRKEDSEWLEKYEHLYD